MYQSYINNYEAMSNRLQELRATNKELQDIISKFCEETAQPDISFYLILPIQRLPRYEVPVHTLSPGHTRTLTHLRPAA